MRFEFHPLALAEYQDAAYYYAGCQPGLDARYMAAVERVIEHVARMQFSEIRGSSARDHDLCCKLTKSPGFHCITSGLRKLPPYAG